MLDFCIDLLDNIYINPKETMARKVNPKTVKVIDAVISLLTEEELEIMRLKGALNLDVRQQLILAFGMRKPKCSPEQAKENFGAIKSQLDKCKKNWDWTKKANTLLLEYFYNNLV